MTANTQALGFLEVVEEAESKFLSWGLVDTAFTESELYELAGDYIDRLNDEGEDLEFVDEHELAEWLLGNGLLFSLPGAAGARRYRSRMAESVRLFSRLRQLFSESKWRTAPTLVADYRFHRRPRVFPRRDTGLQEVAVALGLNGVERQILSALLRVDSESELLLSGFQVRAAKSILSGLSSKDSGGTLVSAGTASGKSLSFYLPAFLYLLSVPDHVAYAHVLAVYPRNELLKDQLRSTLEQCLLVNSSMKAARGRCVSVGAFFGHAPNDAAYLDTKWGRESWPAQGSGRTCPYLLCPACGQSEMIWPDKDRANGQERLVCLDRRCGQVLESDEIRLTRSRMAEEPPDILFTTTEMLNRQMSSHQFRGLFGVGAKGTPGLVLLDEVHTYSGVSGAQVALLLRRWRRTSKARPHFVGLSATLADAQAFFSDLTGVFSNRVQHVEPAVDEMEHQGTEYQLALRGDPVSGTALLSTSIQAAMLLSRIISPAGQEDHAGGAYGSRVFVFTDNLDVTNRLYDGLRDAEGFWATKPNSREIGSLANLRNPSLAPHIERWAAGQSWDLAEEIGHSLAHGTRSKVGRTSSQDQGVDQRASVIVATASLEVGFDDPTCGAVIQHKAPRGPASFIQRRGRAGRGRSMRPWTVIVLSDYGRDRVAYQGWERLFSPVVVPRALPLENTYVSRIQAGYFLMDWVSARIPESKYTKTWDDFSGRKPPSFRKREYIRQLHALLEQPAALAEFATHLGQALGLDQARTDDVLWNPPRPLVLEVIPTLLRRLDSDWKNADGTSDRSAGGRGRSPMPEFVTPNLFDDLSLTELSIALDGAKAEHMMRLRQGLAEFAPGRVSKRFAIDRGGVSHWVSPPTDGTTIPVESFVDMTAAGLLGEWTIMENDGTAVEVIVVQPRRITVSSVPAGVADTSNSFLEWGTSITPVAPGQRVKLPERTPWRELLGDFVFHTHSTGNAVEVRRFTRGARYEIKHTNGDVVEGRVGFSIDPGEGVRPAALGMADAVDGCSVDLSFPNARLANLWAHPGLLKGVRTALFKARVLAASELSGVANEFQRQWLADIFLSYVTFNALGWQLDLKATLERLEGEDGDLTLSGVLPIIFRAPDSGGDIESEDVLLRQGRRLYQSISGLLSEESVLSVLKQAATTLWEEPDESWLPWLRAKTSETVAGAILGAAHRICDGSDMGDILVDVESPSADSAHPDTVRLWFVEATPGGAGFVTELLRSVTENCHRFLSLVGRQLEPADFELADLALQRILQWSSPESDGYDGAISSALGRYRAADSHAAALSTYEEFSRLLRERGVGGNASVQNAVNLRLLRSGASPVTDRVLAGLLAGWTEAEEFLGIEIEARVFSCLKSDDEWIGVAFENELDTVAQEERRAWRSDLLLSLLWPRGAAVRREALQYYTPFTSNPEPDRLLLPWLTGSLVRDVQIESDDWFNDLRTSLLEYGEVSLSADPTRQPELREAVLGLLVNEIDTGPLLLFPEIRGVTTTGDRVRVELELPEYLT